MTEATKTPAVTMTVKGFDLLSMDLTSFADLPSFEVPAIGSYKFRVKSAEAKQVGDKASLAVKLDVVETLELANATDTPPAAGATVDQLFNLENEFGQGLLKEFLAPFSVALGLTNGNDLVAGIIGVEFAASLKHRKDKTDPTKVYAAVSNVVI